MQVQHSDIIERHAPERMRRTGVLLVNLGTPEQATPGHVRRYLRQFLSDRRVVEIPPIIWQLILNGIILPLRAGKVAKKYAQIWRDGGSPLRVLSQGQLEHLQVVLQNRGLELDVDLAMTYGSPAIPAALDRMRQRGVERLLVLPLFPQYSATTTAAVMDPIYRDQLAQRNVFELRTLRHYADDPGYIAALAFSIQEHWRQHGAPDFDRGDRLLMSFHGLPERNLGLGDPYFCYCHKTARLLAQQLGLSTSHYVVSFQSRFGRAKWLQPYTDGTTESLARAGCQRLDVVCPGFAVDCLETLEEIGEELQQTFLAAGGKSFHAIPCLNVSTPWIEALADLVVRHTQGWPVEASQAQASRQLAQQQCAAAQALSRSQPN